MESNKKWAHDSNTPKPNSKLKEIWKNNALEIKCNLEQNLAITVSIPLALGSWCESYFHMVSEIFGAVSQIQRVWVAI